MIARWKWSNKRVLYDGLKGRERGKVIVNQKLCGVEKSVEYYILSKLLFWICFVCVCVCVWVNHDIINIMKRRRSILNYPLSFYFLHVVSYQSHIVSIFPFHLPRYFKYKWIGLLASTSMSNANPRGLLELNSPSLNWSLMNDCSINSLHFKPPQSANTNGNISNI